MLEPVWENALPLIDLSLVESARTSGQVYVLLNAAQTHLYYHLHSASFLLEEKQQCNVCV